MRADDHAHERADLIAWSMPLLSDCLGMAYRACLGGNEQLVLSFMQQHRRVWLSLIRNDPASASEARKLLKTLAQLCRLGEEALSAIDEIVLD